MHGDDRIGIGVGSLAIVTVVIGVRVANREDQQAAFGVDRGRVPHRAAAGLPGIAAPGLAAGFAGRGGGIETPGLLAGLAIVRGDKIPGGEFGAGGADDHHAVIDLRRHGQRECAARIPDLFRPFDLAGLGIECHQVAVELRDIEQAIRHRHTATLRAAAQLGVAKVGCVRPKLLSCRCIVGQHVIIRRGDVHDAVDYDRTVFEAAHHAGLDDRHRLQLADIVGGDLVQRREALIVVSAAIEDPVVEILVSAELLLGGDADIGAHRRRIDDGCRLRRRRRGRGRRGRGRCRPCHAGAGTERASQQQVTQRDPGVIVHGPPPQRWLCCEVPVGSILICANRVSSSVSGCLPDG